MRYRVIVESPRSNRRGDVKHRVMYDGEDVETAKMMAWHYTRPFDHISAEVWESATAEDNVGWIGDRVLREPVA